VTEYDDTNRGVLFRNDRKESDRHPDYKGSINVEGVEYWLSAWLKESKTGTKFMSLSVNPKQPSAHHEAKANGYQPQQVPDDDIPF
jgi:uncharacterized protein (DUF736 family)